MAIRRRRFRLAVGRGRVGATLCAIYTRLRRLHSPPPADDVSAAFRTGASAGHARPSRGSRPRAARRPSGTLGSGDRLPSDRPRRRQRATPPVTPGHVTAVRPVRIENRRRANGTRATVVDPRPSSSPAPRAIVRMIVRRPTSAGPSARDGRPNNCDSGGYRGRVPQTGIFPPGGGVVQQ